jgi:hypothetical protein
MLRWVRKLHWVMLPFGVVAALLLWVSGSSVWWMSLSVSVLSLLGLATMGPAIRRAEAHGPNDPATRDERRRRAERMTLALIAVFTVIAVVVGLMVDGPGLAIFLGLMMAVCAPLGILFGRRLY